MTTTGGRMRDLGEKAFVASILEMLTPDDRLLNGFGSDSSAVLLPAASGALVLKIDRAAVPPSAIRGWSDYRVWGRLAVTSNCSDVLAGGGEPLAVMIALVLTDDFSSAYAREIVQGCAEECAEHGIVFAGGDTKQGRESQVIGCAVGTAPIDRILGRSGAHVGDIIVCAGELGGFLGAYLRLDRTSRAGSPEIDQRLLDYIVHPRARWAEAKFLQQGPVAPVAAMDASDGLYDAVSTLAAPHGARIDHWTLPFHPMAAECELELQVPMLNLALMGDWNIFYIFRPDNWTVVETEARREGLQLTRVGVVTAEPGVRVAFSPGEEPRLLKPIYNDHFVARLEDEGSLLDRLKTPVVEV